MRLGILSVLFISILFACSGGTKKSSQHQINENVKSYLFLSDSVQIETEVTDTLKTEDLKEFISQVEKNLSLINQDLDTLSIMIDDRAYKALSYQKEIESTSLLRKSKYKDSLQNVEKKMLELQLKQAKLQAKKEGFKQTNRILLHLQRSVWADIAGFDVVVKYLNNDEEIQLELLLDANYNVID